MRKWLRGAVTMTLSAGLALTGCASEEPREVLAEPAPEQELRKEDTGDWLPERLSACGLITDGSSTAECGMQESFDLSTCDAESLEALDAQGSFTVHVIGNDNPDDENFASALKFQAGGPVLLDGTILEETRVDSRTFFLSNIGTLRDGRPVRSSFVGCKATGRDRVVGCMAICIAGRPTFQATFEAERVRRLPGEGESSGLTLLGEAIIPRGTAVDVFVAKGHAYVVALNDFTTGPGGLYVFDLADRAAPRLVKSVYFQGNSYWNDVWARGDALYVASNRTGLIVFDISNPAEPQFVRSLPGTGTLDVHTLHGDGDRLYAMSPGPDTKTLIFDVKNPLQPVLIGSYQSPDVEVNFFGFTHDAFAQGDRLYVSHWRSGLLIVDVSDPANPVQLGEYRYPRATSHTSRVGRFGERVIAFEGGEDWGAHLRVVDITDPGRAELLAEYKLSPGVSIHNMELRGGRLYLTHYHHGVRVLDVSRPEQPKEVAYFNTWSEEGRYSGTTFFDGAVGIHLADDGLLYIADNSRGLVILSEP
jgi:hypothetical protein